MFPTSPNPVDVTTINFCSGAGCSANYSTYINAIDRVLNSKFLLTNIV